MFSTTITNWRGSKEYWEDLTKVYRAKYGENHHSYIYVPLADALCNLGRTTEAMETLELGLALMPNSRAGQIMLARLRYGKGDVAGAKTLLAEIVSRWPGATAAVTLLCEILVNDGEYARAYEHASRLLDYFPDAPTVKTMARRFKMLMDVSTALEAADSHEETLADVTPPYHCVDSEVISFSTEERLPRSPERDLAMTPVGHHITEEVPDIDIAEPEFTEPCHCERSEAISSSAEERLPRSPERDLAMTPASHHITEEAHDTDTAEPEFAEVEDIPLPLMESPVAEHESLEEISTAELACENMAPEDAMADPFIFTQSADTATETAPLDHIKEISTREILAADSLPLRPAPKPSRKKRSRIHPPNPEPPKLEFAPRPLMHLTDEMKADAPINLPNGRLNRGKIQQSDPSRQAIERLEEALARIRKLKGSNKG